MTEKTITDEIRSKIAKVYELVKRGVDGEKQSAEMALDRLLKRYNLSSEEIENIHLKEYNFKYYTWLDERLLFRLLDYFFPNKYNLVYKDTLGVKELCINMEYLDYIQVECAYEYFKRHMNNEWRINVLPQLKKINNPKILRIRRKELQQIFYETYVLASGIYHESELVEGKQLSEREKRDYRLMYGVEGGKFNKQLTRGLYLENINI